ncbi:MAG: hypothetical protein R2733_12445 [Acidimicrobiales bacterium]
MAQTFDLETARQIVDDGSGEFERWIAWFRSSGHHLQASGLQETHIVAISAAVRFSTAGCPREKIERFLVELLDAYPGSDTDWVAVNHTGSKRIEIVPGPFTFDVRSARRRPPVVFDPYAIFQQLRE